MKNAISLTMIRATRQDMQMAISALEQQLSAAKRILDRLPNGRHAFSDLSGSEVYERFVAAEEFLDGEGR